jgi:hypothetical protein
MKVWVYSSYSSLGSLNLPLANFLEPRSVISVDAASENLSLTENVDQATSQSDLGP